MSITPDRSLNLVRSLKELGFPAPPEITLALLSYNGLQKDMTVGELVDIASQARDQIEGEYQEMLAGIGTPQTKLHIITAILGNIGSNPELTSQTAELARPFRIEFDYRDLPEHLCGLLATQGFVTHLNELSEKEKD